MSNFTYFNILFLFVWLQVINKVKFIHQGEGDSKVKEKYLHSFRFYVGHTFCKRVVCILLNAFLYCFYSYPSCYSFLKGGETHPSGRSEHDSFIPCKRIQCTMLQVRLYVTHPRVDDALQSTRTDSVGTVEWQ